MNNPQIVPATVILKMFFNSPPFKKVWKISSLLYMLNNPSSEYYNPLLVKLSSLQHDQDFNGWLTKIRDLKTNNTINKSDYPIESNVVNYVRVEEYTTENLAVMIFSENINVELEVLSNVELNLDAIKIIDSEFESSKPSVPDLLSSFSKLKSIQHQLTDPESDILSSELLKIYNLVSVG